LSFFSPPRFYSQYQYDAFFSFSCPLSFSPDWRSLPHLHKISFSSSQAFGLPRRTTDIGSLLSLDRPTDLPLPFPIRIPGHPHSQFHLFFFPSNLLAARSFCVFFFLIHVASSRMAGIPPVQHSFGFEAPDRIIDRAHHFFLSRLIQTLFWPIHPHLQSRELVEFSVIMFLFSFRHLTCPILSFIAPTPYSILQVLLAHLLFVPAFCLTLEHFPLVVFKFPWVLSVTCVEDQRATRSCREVTSALLLF